jgi:hypothetical protein
MYDLVTPMNAASGQTRETGLPGTTASGIASASQLIESASCVALQTGTTAASGRLFLMASVPVAESYQIVSPLPSAVYPVLAGIWDNDDDALFDTV